MEIKDLANRYEESFTQNYQVLFLDDSDNIFWLVKFQNGGLSAENCAEHASLPSLKNLKLVLGSLQTACLVNHSVRLHVDYREICPHTCLILKCSVKTIISGLNQTKTTNYEIVETIDWNSLKEENHDA